MRCSVSSPSQVSRAPRQTLLVVAARGQGEARVELGEAQQRRALARGDEAQELFAVLVVERVDDAPKVADRRRRLVHRLGVDGVAAEVVDVDRLLGAADERPELGGTEEPQPARLDDLVQPRHEGRALRAQLGVEPEVGHERCEISNVGLDGTH